MHLENGFLLFPAISIPVEQKDEFSCPETHVRTLEQRLEEVDKIITVGWRATERDFLRMLHEKLPRQSGLMIVSGDQEGASETRSHLTNSALPTKDATIIASKTHATVLS